MSSKKWMNFNIESVALSCKKNQPKSKRRQIIKKNQTGFLNRTIQIRCQQLLGSVNFDKQVKPQTRADLAVHSKKLEEVELWLDQFALNKGPVPRNLSKPAFLLISGPTGSGKTSAVQLLCEEKAIDVTEWLNPISHEVHADGSYSYMSRSTQISIFTEFVIESCHCSLASAYTTSICLVKDFPHIFLDTPEHFVNVLNNISTATNLTIIFIATESGNNNWSVHQKLFTNEVKTTHDIQTITFNPCAQTFLKSVLKHCGKIVKEDSDKFHAVSDDVVEGILHSSQGDICCAVNQFYLAALQGSNAMTLKKTILKMGIKRKRTSTTLSLKSKPKDEKLGLFHSIGRVLNPKVDPVTNTLNYDFSSLIVELSTQPRTMLAFLFENYINHFNDVSDASHAADLLSISNLLMENWSERHQTYVLGLWISVLGLMIHNKHRVSKWNSIKGPVIVKHEKLTINNCDRFISPLDSGYFNTITGNTPFHSFQ